jgi:hypothetical protein
MAIKMGFGVFTMIPMWGSICPGQGGSEGGGGVQVNVVVVFLLGIGRGFVIVMNDVVHSFVSCANHESFQATPDLINDMI